MSSILKVNTIQDGGGNVLLTSDGSGTLTTNNIGGQNTPAFSANRLSGTITVSVNTWTQVVFNNELYDTASAYDTSNGRFTVPSGQAGKYSFSTSFYSFESTANNNITGWYTAFYKNGSLEVFTTTGGGSHVGNGRANLLSADLDLAAGDYIELYFRVNCGSGNIAYEVGHTYNLFSGHRLIGA